jgi:hypothetical protein
MPPHGACTQPTYAANLLYGNNLYTHEKQTDY